MEPEPVRTVAPPAPRVRALPPPVSSSHDGGDDIRIFDVVRVLWRRKWLIGAVIIAVLAVAVAYNRVATPIYQARARVLIEPDSAQVMPFRSVTEDTARFDYYVTQLDVLRSRGLARKTLEQLHLLSEDPTRQSGQINQLLRNLKVNPVKSDLGPSRVIDLTVESEIPDVAAQLANGHAQAYVDQNLELRRHGNREASQWLNERLAGLRKDMTNTAGALQQYREQKDAASLDDRQNIVVQKLAQLNAQVTTVRAERVEKEAVYQQLKSIQESGAPLDTLPAILSNGYIQGLKQELAALQRDRGLLAEKLGDLHPDMIKVNTAIQTAERKLKDEMDKVVEAIRNDYRATEARERGLLKALEDQKHEVQDLNQKSVPYAALQRDAASSQQIFDSVLQRLKETELSGELQVNNVRILDAAEVPRRPIWPRVQFNLMLALLTGGMIAVGLAIALEYLNPRITKPEHVGETLGLPLLGIAPQVAALKRGELNVNRLPPAFREAIRSIRTSLLLSGAAPVPRTLAVTSTTAGEGKTAVSSALGVSLATAGRRVLLVDADMRRPQVHRIFNVSQSPGLSDIMSGGVKPSEALVESSVKGLFVLPAGAHGPTDPDLLESERLTALIRGLSQVFDVVLLDCPPVMALADASIVANAATGVLFVVGSGITSREAAQAAVDRLSAVQGALVGVVLNKAKVDDLSGYRNPYYYQSEEIA
jgi:capsular exopolysaccharide synthesis family protein